MDLNGLFVFFAEGKTFFFVYPCSSVLICVQIIFIISFHQCPVFGTRICTGIHRFCFFFAEGDTSNVFNPCASVFIRLPNEIVVALISSGCPN